MCANAGGTTPQTAPQARLPSVMVTRPQTAAAGHAAQAYVPEEGDPVIKVIGGEFRGRCLLSVPGESTRPPLAKVRGAVANILAERVEDARVIDFFSGTGSYSIELLSRGAARATCIDKNPKAVEVIRKNIVSLGIESRVRLIAGDALRVARSLEKTDSPYDILLVAPPYFTGLDRETMDILGTSPLVGSAGIVVLQQHKKEKHEESYGNLALKRTYMYGDTRVSTYSAKIGEPFNT